MAKIGEYTYGEAREIAIGAARHELKQRGINPAKATVREYWEALDARLEREYDLPEAERTIATRYYTELDTNRNQQICFERDVRAWQREWTRLMGR